MNKLIIIITLLFFGLTSISLADNNCNRIQDPRNVPCDMISTWNYTPPCNQYTAKVFFMNGTGVENFTFSNYGSTGLCSYEWNITTQSSYTFTINNGDTGQITVERTNEVDSKMLSIIIGIAAIILYFTVLGFLNTNVWIRYGSFFLSMVELVYMLGILYVNEMGGILSELLKINFYIFAILGLGLGLLTLVMHNLSVMDFSQDEELLTPVKWNGVDNKW